MLSRDYLTSLLSYDKLTGKLRWKVDRDRYKCKGKEAGTLFVVLSYNRL